jgi:integrase
MASTGIRKRGGSYEAWVYDKRTKQKIRRTFPTEAAAKSWRADGVGAVRRRTLTAPTATTIRQAWEAWLAGARKGEVRTRSGDVFKPGVIRSYETAMKRVLPEFGALRLSELARVDVQDVADRMLGEGRDPSTIRNTLMPLRAIYRRALARGEVAVNPTTGLELPAVRGTRDRVVSREEAPLIVAAVPEADRALWATALYAGLRRGELMALLWEDVPLGAGTIHVERSWDVREGPVAPKSRRRPQGPDRDRAPWAPARAPSPHRAQLGARLRALRGHPVRPGARPGASR